VLKLTDDITKGQCSQWQTDFKSWKEEPLARTFVGVRRAFQQQQQQQQPKSKSSFRTRKTAHEDGLENQGKESRNHTGKCSLVDVQNVLHGKH
jgi:hypothetical protein